MYRNKLYTLFVLALMLAFPGILIAQQDDSTPTSAPSKTPTPQVSPTPDTTNAVWEPLTQRDLSILTGNVQRPNGIVWHNNKLYTACNGDYTLYEIDATTSATRTYIYGVRNAHTLYAETTSEGRVNLWVPDFETNRVLFIDGAGAPQPIVSDLAGPWGIAYLDEESFLVTNQRGGTLVLVGRDGEMRELLSDLRLPSGIAVDEDYVYVANYGRPRQAIEWFPTTDIAEENEITREVLVSGLQNTTGVIQAPDGYLYFAYALGTRGVVGRVDPEFCRENGGCTNDQVEIVLYTEMAAPLAGLSISPDMRLFVHTMFSPDIYWVSLE